MQSLVRVESRLCGGDGGQLLEGVAVENQAGSRGSSLEVSWKVEIREGQDDFSAVPWLEGDLVEKPGGENESSVDWSNHKECLRGILWERVKLRFVEYLLRSVFSI